MATKSTPLKRKLESNSDTPSKKRNCLSLKDKLDIIKRFQNVIFVLVHFDIKFCSICTHLFRLKFFNVVFVLICLDGVLSCLKKGTISG